MTSPLEGKIAATIGKAFASTFYACTVTRTTPGTPNPATPWEPTTPTVTVYTCKGMVDEYSDYAVANSLVEAKDRKILILATSLDIEPDHATDSVTIRGATYNIVPPVKIDPAMAVWEIQGRI